MGTLGGAWQCSPRMVAQVEHPEHQEAAASPAWAEWLWPLSTVPLGKGSSCAPPRWWPEPHPHYWPRKCEIEVGSPYWTLKTDNQGYRHPQQDLPNSFFDDIFPDTGSCLPHVTWVELSSRWKAAKHNISWDLSRFLDCHQSGFKLGLALRPHCFQLMTFWE